MIGKLNVGGGGIDIKGVLENYTARENLSAGDFVKAMTEQVKNEKESTLTVSSRSSIDYWRGITDMFPLDENRIFCNIQGNRDDNGFGRIITIGNDNIITQGSSMTTYYYPNFKKINNNKVLMIYSTDSYYKLYAKILTIEGNSITEGTAYQLTNNNYDNYYGSEIVIINENKFMLIFSRGNNVNSQILSAAICTIEENNITMGIVTQIDSTNTVQYKTYRALLLDNNKVFVVYNSGSYLYANIIAYSDNLITSIGTATSLVYAYISNYNNDTFYINFIDDTLNKILLTYSENNYIYSKIITINGDIITTGTKTTLKQNSNSSSYFRSFSMVKLSNGSYSVIHRSYTQSGYNYYYTELYQFNVTISNDVITPGTDTQIYGTSTKYTTEKSSITATMYKEDTIFIYFLTNDSTSNMDYSIDRLVIYKYYFSGVYKVTLSTESIAGVTKEKALKGDTVGVYIPDYLD